MQNTARDTQPVSWSEIEQVIKMNPHRKRCVEAIVPGSCAVADDDTKVSVAWLPGWTYANANFKATPISLALMATDPLYEISALNTRREMERESATELASEFDAMYAKHNGRSRGWVKTATSVELSQWAGGATEVPFDWTNLLEKRKILSALLDLVCVKFGIRMAIWWSEHKKLGIWPIYESDDSSWASAPILNIEVLTSGEAHVLMNKDYDIRVKSDTWRDLFKTIGEWQWIRPSTSGSIGGKTLTELKADYGLIAGEQAVATLPKKIDKETLANLTYRYQCMDIRFAVKEQHFY
jgi:hypothetical protein